MRKIIPISIFFLLIHFISCDNARKEYEIPPRLSSEYKVKNLLKPSRIRFFKDTLFVSYVNIPRIDLFDIDMNLVSSIELVDKDTVKPTSFCVYDSGIVVTEHNKNRVVLYDRKGKVKSSFGMMPDGFVKLFPFDVYYHGGVSYISDIMQNSVLAVSMVSAKGITDIGELILMIPKDSSFTLEFPSALYVTPDGRLLVGDAKKGTIDVFTCEGSYIYSFDKIKTPRPITIQAFDYDSKLDPELVDQNKQSFDPSGLRYQGRIHALDANNRIIHMYNPQGKYIASYPNDSLFLSPSGLAIDRKRHIIFVSDSKAAKIYRFEY